MYKLSWLLDNNVNLEGSKGVKGRKWLGNEEENYIEEQSSKWTHTDSSTEEIKEETQLIQLFARNLLTVPILGIHQIIR